MEILVNSDGIRICKQIVLEQYRKNPQGLRKILEALKDFLHITEDDLINWLIYAAASEWQPEMKCHICKSEGDLKLTPIRLVAPDPSAQFGYHHINSFQIFSVLCQNCLDSGWKPPDEIKIDATYRHWTRENMMTLETRRFP